MDYIYGNKKDTIMIEESDGETIQRDRLFEYYTKIQEYDGTDVSEKTKCVIKRIAYSMSEEDARVQCTKIVEATKKRMMAYHNALMGLQQNQDDELQEIKDTIVDLIDAYKDYDFERGKTVEINGNRFTFVPEQFDIEKYKDSLARLGNESQGNTWLVDINENGEVVLHW